MKVRRRSDNFDMSKWFHSECVNGENLVAMLYSHSNATREIAWSRRESQSGRTGLDDLAGYVHPRSRLPTNRRAGQRTQRALGSERGFRGLET